MEIIVEAEWLFERLSDQNVKVIDCRFSLANSEEGQMQYAIEHIPGAYYFDLEKDLSGPVEKHGGRHPLPNLHQLKKKLETAGITNDTTIVAYDQGVGAFAARFWWLLTYLGHEKVYILNGGYPHWKEKGFPVTADVPQSINEQVIFHVHVNDNILASYGEVKEIVSSNDPDVILIDSREEKRYLGIEEPIDKKCGRIPGAINKVWVDRFENGFFYDQETYVKQMKDIAHDKHIIVYCGSGVTAIPNFISLKLAGYQNVKLYIGSFSDWISYDDNEIDIGEKTD